MSDHRYTHATEEILRQAQSLAQEACNPSVAPDHLFTAALSYVAPLVQQASSNKDPALIKVLQTKANEMRRQHPRLDPAPQQLSITLETQKVLEKAASFAKKWGDAYITPEAIVVGLMALEGPVSRALKEAGITENSLENAVVQARQGRKADSENADPTTQALEKYGVDMTAQAAQGKLDPVIGRDDEIRQVIQVLSQRKKNNPLLIGDPGVGKTAIVEGLAQRIVKGDVPESLKNTRLISLDLGMLVAGAKFRGEFEERLKRVLEEVVAAPEEIVLFIDEIHTLVGAGNVEGALDASNMMKPYLARGALHCVGATTLDEYRKHIEKDAALTRRFQPIRVVQPSGEETLSILRGLREKFELFYGLRIMDSACIEACHLGRRYLSHRFSPDREIDLIDGAASRLCNAVSSKPEALDELERRLLLAKIEKEALSKEKDPESQNRLKDVGLRLEELELSVAELTHKWQADRQKLQEQQRLKSLLDESRKEAEKAQREGNLGRAGELIYGVIPSLEKELNQDEKTLFLLKQEVSAADIAAEVARITGIPLDKMLESERHKLLHMEESLQQRVRGQHQAVSVVSEAVRRARAGLSDPARPVGSFLFLGPTGVGKTELCKALADFLFDDPTAMIRLDMSEFMERHSISRLIGAPPGYVGYDEGGLLTEAVRRRPYSLVLFDEIEKAHRDVFNLLLQVMDDGHLTDSHGRQVDFKNTLIVLTSNIGSPVMSAHPVLSQDHRAEVMQDVRRFFLPEFLNRLDDIVFFKKLSMDDMCSIVHLELEKFNRVLKTGQQGGKLVLSKTLEGLLAEEGYDPDNGARPLKRLFQKRIVTPLSKEILAGTLAPGSFIEADVDAQDPTKIVIKVTHS